MKKLFKILLKLAIGLVLLLAAAVITVKIMFPPEKLKAMAVAYAKDNLHREISFDGISLNFIGVTLDNFALSEASAFDKGTFVKADKLVAKAAFWPLLKKSVEISTITVDGLEINVVKQKDGSFNFDSMTDALSSQSAAPETASDGQDTSAPMNFNLLAHRIAATDCTFSYLDQQTGMRAGIKHLNVEILDFDLRSPFTVKINFTTEYKETGGPAVSVPVTVDLTMSLEEMNLSRAYATLNKLGVSYKNIRFQLWGGVKNFENPQADFTGKITGITHQTFADFLPDLPAFSLPEINVRVQADADLQHSTARLQTFTLSILNSAVKASADAGWGGNTVTYNAKADVRLMLGEITQLTALLDDFGLGGQVTGSVAATHKNNGKDVKGALTLADVAAKYPPVALTAMNGVIQINSVDDVRCNTLTGLLNNEKFTSSFSYQNIKDVLNLVFNLNLSKLTLDKFPGGSAEDTAQTPAQTQSAAEAAPGPETRMNIKADVAVGAIRVPYFEAEGFSAKADLKNVTPSMTHTSGTVDFTLKPGGIRDLDTFVKQNNIVKIILLPLSIVNRVALALNVDLFPQENAAGKGLITYQSAEGRYTFANGLMKIDKTDFISKLTRLNASGTADFPSGALDMKVSATVLTSQTPVVIKIGGTMDNPKGKLDVLNTVGSLVGGILNYKTPGKVAASTAKTAGSAAEGAVKTTEQAAKDTVSAAKDTVKALGGLFKKKDSTENK